jgi:Uma2 family endonuclease
MMAANPTGPPAHLYSLDEYFALEQAGEARYEYWDGEIVSMSGGSLAHGLIASNIHFRLRQKLVGGACVAFTADLPVKTPSLPPYRYPDAAVVCGDVRVENIRGVDALLNPVLIVEVLSPSTERRDREQKFMAYRTIPSFKEYLLIAQDVHYVLHQRLQSGGVWVPEEIAGLDRHLTLDSVGCVLAMAEIYEGVTCSGIVS